MARKKSTKNVDIQIQKRNLEGIIMPITIEEGSYFNIFCNPCTKCGSTDWDACNVDNQGEIIECNRCNEIITVN